MTIPNSTRSVEPSKFPQTRAAACSAGMSRLTRFFVHIKTHIPQRPFDQLEHISRRSHEPATRGDRYVPAARLAHLVDGTQRHARGRQTESVATRDQRSAAPFARHHWR